MTSTVSMNGQGNTPAGWFADPTGRHQLRYWNGAGWTDDVADAGVTGRDPLATRAPLWGATPGYGAYGSSGMTAATVAGGRSSLRIAGCLLALAGGTSVVVATFLDWLALRGTPVSFTGWDIYDVRSTTNQNVFVDGGMFGGDIPFFSGLTTLIVGIVLVVLALLLLALPGSRRAGARELNGGVAFLFTAFASLLQIPGLVNLSSWLSAGRDNGVIAEPGFYLVLVGAAVAWVGILVAVIGKRRPVF